MYNNRKKYSPFVYLISFFYLSFFFLSPYFHQHNKDSGVSHSQSHSLSGEKNGVIHSHLSNDFTHSHHSEESDNHYDFENHNSHLYQINYVFGITQPKNLQHSPNIDFYSTVEYSINDNAVPLINTYPIEHFSQLQWEKYVHSAANVSPPIPLGYNI